MPPPPELAPIAVGVNDPLRLLLAIAQHEGVGDTARTASLGGAIGAGIATLMAPDEPGVIALGAFVGVLIALQHNTN